MQSVACKDSSLKFLYYMWSFFGDLYRNIVNNNLYLCLWFITSWLLQWRFWTVNNFLMKIKQKAVINCRIKCTYGMVAMCYAAEQIVSWQWYNETHQCCHGNTWSAAEAVVGNWSWLTSIHLTQNHSQTKLTQLTILSRTSRLSPLDFVAVPKLLLPVLLSLPFPSYPSIPSPFLPFLASLHLFPFPPILFICYFLFPSHFLLSKMQAFQVILHSISANMCAFYACENLSCGITFGPRDF